MGEGRGRISGVDLHLHSLASDGTLAPAEVVAAAAQRGVEILALTDHDTTLGIPSARLAGQEWRVEVIPGIEMTAEAGEDLHLLGYFIDAGFRPLQETLLHLRRRRWQRAQRMVELLAGMGMPLDWPSVSSQTWDSLGRLHIARALWLRGYVSHPKEAFNLYLDPGRPAYVSLTRPSAREALDLIRAAGGVAVLAHPVIPGRDDPGEKVARLATTLPGLVEAGLGGLEVYYYEYSLELTRTLVAMAESYGLAPTGGSDFHGPDGRLVTPGDVAVPREAVERLKAAAWTSSPEARLHGRGGRW